MKFKKPKLYDVVAVRRDIEEQKVRAGYVGTVVEVLEEGVYLVEFSDKQGRTLLLPTLPTDALLVLESTQAELAPI